MTEQPEDIHTQITAMFAKAREEAARQKIARTDAASQREDAFTARVAAEAVKVAKVLAVEMAGEHKQGHVQLPRNEDDAFYMALADILRQHDVQVSKLLLATEGNTLKNLKAQSEWDNTQLNYSYFAHFGPASAIVEHMQAYDPRDEGEVIRTY